VDEIAIDIINLKSSQACLEGGFDPFRAMIGVPEFRSDENVFPPHYSRLESFPHRIANRLFIAVSLGAVEMAKAHFQGGPGCLFRYEGVGNKRAKPDGGNSAGSVGEGDLLIAKHIGACHAHTPGS
jgi:hypothetical protein